MTAKKLIGLVSAVGLTALAADARAGTAMEEAMQAGAEKLTADEIAERLTGKTVTFVAAGNGDTYLVFYGSDNDAMSRKVGSDTVSSGLYAVTDRDQVCLGWEGRDLPRLRCVDVLLIDGVMHKFKADGTLSGRITELVDGNTT
jgi:hypothetical protein